MFDNGKYKIVSKLGYGVYSTVWLARDQDTKHHVALKVLTADSFGTANDTSELNILTRLQNQHNSHPGASHILPLLHHFYHRGPHGNHVCLVFPAMGPDFAHFRRLFPALRVPLRTEKRVARQVLRALAYLHGGCGVVHTDIKPSNILIEAPAIKEMFEHAPSEVFEPEEPPLPAPQDFYMGSIQVHSGEEDLATSDALSVRLADFGTSSWFDKHLKRWIQHDMLRAPEVILGAEWDYKVDIWNLGVLIWELAEGRLLFDGTWTLRDSYTPEAHLAQMTAVLGAVLKQLLARSKEREWYFDGEGNLVKPSTFPGASLARFCRNPCLKADERKKFLNLIAQMVRIDPHERPDA